MHLNVDSNVPMPVPAKPVDSVPEHKKWPDMVVGQSVRCPDTLSWKDFSNLASYVAKTRGWGIIRRKAEHRIWRVK